MILAAQLGLTRFKCTSTIGHLGGYKDIYHQKRSWWGEAGIGRSKSRLFEAPVAWNDWEPFPRVTRHVPKAPLAPKPRVAGSNPAAPANIPCLETT